MPVDKKAIFMGKSLDAIKAFPENAKQITGYEIHRVQTGLHPNNYRPMRAVGKGVYEIKVSSDDSWFRALYVTKFGKDVYILHAFEKKQNKTPQKEIEIAKREYSALEKSFRKQKSRK